VLLSNAHSISQFMEESNMENKYKEPQMVDNDSGREAQFLKRKQVAEKLLEQIKDLKQGDKITVRTEDSIWDSAIQDNSVYVHHYNMIFDSFDQNDKEGVSITAFFHYKENEKESGLPEKGHFSAWGESGSSDSLEVFHGFDKVSDEDADNEKDYLV